MNQKEFSALLKKGENEHVEFKVANTPPELIARAVCAFLNGGGGRLLLGVSDDGQLLGLKDVKAKAQIIEGQLATMISPQALWTVEPMRIGDLDTITIEVPEGMDKPYVTAGAIYFRRGNQSIEATREAISTIIENRMESSQRWERQIAIGAEQKDLHDDIIRATARRAVQSGRWQGDSENSEEFLYALGLLENGAVTNAALLLFGKNPSRLLPQARVRLLVIPEGKTSDLYEKDRIFEGCLLRVADEIPAALATHIGGVTSQFSDEDWQREDYPIYPGTALREGIMNSLVHRDYRLSGSITITIYADSLEISNPGGLPGELTTADLKRDHPSVPRNPDIAYIFFLSGFIEIIGRGTQRIVEDCRKVRLPDPKWHSSALETRLTLFARATRGQFEDLNERQQAILKYLHQNKRAKIADLIKFLGETVTSRTVRNDLQNLVDGGWVIRRGRGRSTSYTRGRNLKPN